MGACVEVDPNYIPRGVGDDATTIVPISATVGESDTSTANPDPGTESETTDGDVSTSTGSGEETSDSHATALDDADGSSSGEPEPLEPPCDDVVFADDFEDSIIHPRWQLWGQNAMLTTEVDGALWFSLPAGSPSAGLTAAEPGDLTHNRITLELAALPIDDALSFTLQLNGVGCTTQIRIQGATVQVGTAPLELYDPTQHRFLRIFHDGVSFVFSRSSDGNVWTTMHQQPACALPSANVFIFSQGVNLRTPSLVGLGSFENCELPSSVTVP